MAMASVLLSVKKIVCNSKVVKGVYYSGTILTQAIFKITFGS